MKEILYRSTRGGFSGVKASEAILQGLAEDGGLFVPETMPVLDVKMEDLAGKSYQEIAYEVMKLFLTDYTEEDLNLPLIGQGLGLTAAKRLSGEVLGRRRSGYLA